MLGLIVSKVTYYCSTGDWKWNRRVYSIVHRIGIYDPHKRIVLKVLKESLFFGLIPAPVMITTYEQKRNSIFLKHYL